MTFLRKNKLIPLFSLSLTIFAIVLSVSCKKEDPPEPSVTPTSTTPTTTETCSDGIQNQDETGIDCGGVCSACNVNVTAPCTQTANTSNFPIGFQDDSYYSVSCQIESIYGNYQVVGNGSFSDMTINTNVKPTVSGMYTTTSSTNMSSLGSNGIVISTVAGGSMSFLYYASAGQDVYVNVNGTTVSFEFCGLLFNSGSSGSITDLQVSGFLQCN